MRFEYIRAIDPPTPDEPTTPLEPVVHAPHDLEDEELGELIESACRGVSTEASVPAPHSVDLPAFLGASLSSVPLETPRPAARLEVEPQPLLRAWSSPGMLTMTIAVVATAVFSALVILR